MRRLLLPAALLLPLAVSAEPKPIEPGRRDSERAVKSGVDPDLQKRIDKAIDQARTYLTKALTAPPPAPPAAGAPAGPKTKKAPPPETPLFTLFQHGGAEEALIGLALVQSGSTPQDPLVQHIWNDLQGISKGRYRDTYPSYNTYSLAVQLMFGDAMMHAPVGKPWPPPDQRDEVLAWMTKLAENLAAGCHGGTWTYACPMNYTAPTGDPKKPYKVEGGEKTLGLDGPALLAAIAVKDGSYDHSNTQYGILGLKAAQLCGVKLKTELHWDQILQHFITTQWKDGPKLKLKVEFQARKKPAASSKEKSPEKGWEEVFTAGKVDENARARGWMYQPPSNGGPCISMTAAGLTALLIARSEVGRLKTAEQDLVDEAIRDGVAWFQQNWNMPVNGYDMYGMERMAVLGSLQSIGKHAWYEELATELVKTQVADGSWDAAKAFPPYGPKANTALSLLVLCRGTREAYSQPYTVGEAEK